METGNETNSGLQSTFLVCEIFSVCRFLSLQVDWIASLKITS